MEGIRQLMAMTYGRMLLILIIEGGGLRWRFIPCGEERKEEGTDEAMVNSCVVVWCVDHIGLWREG